ncbi:chemotaxis protein CheB [Actinoplanes sp. NPDC051859]|uniref:chemotaxis protein CheB n=1 Tax=Actinoplanes sp. NPDC051859 TaxID=3363909 RepID=UPI0037BB6A32
MADEFPVVTLVCSAGGLAALNAVLAPMPADLPAAIVALQHLDPGRASSLPNLLNQITALSVSSASDGETLEPGHVYVAPPGQHTLIVDGPALTLIPSGPVPPYRPSADLLLTTAAIALGRRLIAVVLTGRGNDAATGATAVHHLGGTVIATTAATSTESSMPQATITRDDVADHVLPLRRVAPVLIKLIGGRVRG